MIFYGIQNKARVIKYIYYGIQNKARAIKKVYVGDENDKAVLVYDREKMIQLYPRS